MTERNHTEHFIQRSVFQVYGHRREPGSTLFAIANGGKRSAATGKIMQREGVRAGAPDMFACRDGKPFFIEQKRWDGVLSDCQREFHAELIGAGIEVFTSFGLNETLDLLFERGVIRAPAVRKAA